MKRLALLPGVLTSLLLATSVEPILGQPPTPGDSTFAASLRSLSDSAAQIRLALGAFQRDLPLVGSETVIGRATALHRRCTGLIGAVEAFAPSLRTASVPRGAGDEMVGALARLRRGLDEHCVRGLAPDGAGDRADTLRAWGPHRVSQIQRVLTEYERAAHGFARAVGVRIEPRRSIR